MDKRIIFNPASGGPAVVLTPAPQARGCTLNDDGERLFAAFPNDAAVVKAMLACTPADMADKLANPFPGLTTRIYRPETSKEFVVRVAAKDVPPDARDVTVIDVADVPTDLVFRNAWIVRDGRLVYDMPKARDILRDKIREARAPQLAALDIEYQRADERGDTTRKAEIAIRKQALRDAPADTAIEAAATIEALEAVWLLP